jgi:integrase
VLINCLELLFEGVSNKSGILHNVPLNIQKGTFLQLASLLAPSLGIIISKYLLINTEGKFPYVPARLVTTFKRVSDCCSTDWNDFTGRCLTCKKKCRTHTIFTTRPYLEFKVWNEVTGTLERKREYAVLARCKTTPQLKTVADRWIRECNRLLKEGYHIKPEVVKTHPLLELTVQQAFDYAWHIKKRETDPKSFYKYNQIYLDFFNFMKAYYPTIVKSAISRLTSEHIHEFYEHIFASRTYAKATRGTYKVIFKTFLSLLVDNKKMKADPSPKNKKVKYDSSKNIAFSKKQFTSIKKIIQEKDPELFRFITWMFYTLARPRKELRLLKVKFIDLEKEKIKILIQRSKNKSERILEISPHLMPLIKKLQLEKLPADWYIFGKDGKPGPVPIGQNNYYERMKTFLKELNFSPEYTLYSVKHTGVCYHYLAGVDIMSLRQQTGHEDMESFLVYLKSLGLIDNERFKNNSPAF